MRLLEPGAAMLAPSGSALPMRRGLWRAREPHRGEGRVLIVNGHPDPRPERFCAALCEACLGGARSAGRQADMISPGALPSGDGQGSAHASRDLARALDLVRGADHLTVIFPLWLDKPPLLLSKFFRQVAEAGTHDRGGGFIRRSVHFVVTMAMPAFAHRSISRATRSTSPSQDLISLLGVETDELSFIGSVDTISNAQRKEWLDRLHLLGLQGARSPRFRGH
jgi:putative NADPH-quinone reductase